MSEIAGTIDSWLTAYNQGTTKVQGCKFTNLAACQRVQFCIEYDKASFLSALMLDNCIGNFDSSYLSTEAYFTTSPPPYNTSSFWNSSILHDATNGLTIEHDSAKLKVCLTYRLQESWANQTIYLPFVFCFKANCFDANSEPVVKEWKHTYTIELSISDFADDEKICLLGYFDEKGNELGETFCCDFEGKIIAKFQNKMEGNFSVIPMISREGVLFENNEYLNDCLPQNQSDIITNPNPTQIITKDDIFTICVDASKLEKNTEYNLKPVLISEDTPTTISCPCVTLDLIHTMLAVNTMQSISTFDFTLTGIPQSDLLQVIFTGNGQQTFTFSSLTGGSQIISLVALQAIEYAVLVQTINGCTYTFNASFIHVLTTGDTQSHNEQICP